jgi:uncharacterized protein YigE (DUF2233 family)
MAEKIIMLSKYLKYITWLLLLPVAIAMFAFKGEQGMLSHTVDLKKQNLRFYWKDDKGKVIGSLGRLKETVEAKHQTLVFAMNGGMYMKDQSPQGLYIEDGKELAAINTASNNYGNFYMKPNGIFYITNDGNAFVIPTEKFISSEDIKYATQSGPMLVVDGKIHPAFKEGSAYTNIRNGVGILPGGKILFAMSAGEVNLYDFALWFKNKGCKNALYLDGFVSRTYLPSNGWKQTDGNFGVIIAETKGQ